MHSEIFQIFLLRTTLGSKPCYASLDFMGNRVREVGGRYRNSYANDLLQSASQDYLPVKCEYKPTAQEQRMGDSAQWLVTIAMNPPLENLGFWVHLCFMGRCKPDVGVCSYQRLPESIF